jgi:hypothetical protein
VDPALPNPVGVFLDECAAYVAAVSGEHNHRHDRRMHPEWNEGAARD